MASPDRYLAKLRGTLLSVFHIKPAASPGAPASGTWYKGDIYTDSAGVVWHCTTSGTPGTWAQFSDSTEADDYAGKMLFVDSVYGNDSTGARERPDKPFLTVAAALSAAQSGDQVFIRPGTYSLAAGITIPSGVSIRGSDAKNVLLQMLAVTAATTLVTMGESSRLEDVSLKLTSAGHYTLTGLLWPGTTSATAKWRTSTLTMDNSGAGAGTSNVTGVLVQSTGAPASEVFSARACSVTVLSAGDGNKRALLMNTSAGIFRARDVVLRCSGGTSAIGAEINIAGGLLDFRTGATDGSTADISQTAGTLSIESVTLYNATANGLPFMLRHSGAPVVFGQSGSIGNNEYIVPGYNVKTSLEVFQRLPRNGILKSLTARARVASGAGKSVTYTLRKNGVPTAMVVTLADTTTSNQDTTHSVAVAAGDDISVIATVSGGSAEDVVVTMEYY